MGRQFLDDTVTDLFFRSKAVEARFGIIKGGRPFWLFLFNILASWAILLWVCLHLTLSLQNPVFIVVGIVGFMTFGVFFNVDKVWNRLCGS